MENNKDKLAFPNDRRAHRGLTKREYFAGIAMGALSSNDLLPPTEIARLSVQHADALLAALEKGGKDE